MPPIAVSVEKLTRSFNEKQLFEEITFGIDQGQKVALVGVNGCGKSTLLNIIAGKDQQDEGRVSFQKDIKVSYLAQSPDLSGFETVLDSIFDPTHPESRLLGEYWDLVEKEDPTMDDQLRVQDLVSAIDERNAWDYEYKLKEILGKLGINDLNQTISSMSGGQQKRIALAKALLDEPEFLILDEPTNHLDLDIIEWLEEYLASQNLSILMVTHDRYFLDRVCNEIIEIDRGQIFKYKGNYAYYLEKKSEQEEIQHAEKAKAKNLLSKELDWMRRQPKARGTKAKYRVDAFYETEKKAKVDLSKANMEIKLAGRRQGKKILELKNISKSWGGEAIFTKFSHVFARGEKIGVVGQNGTGKSTFLNVLTGEIAPDTGEIDQGLNTAFGYYHQHTIEEDPGKKVIDVISEIADAIELDDGSQITASQLLNQFLFPPKTQYSQVSKLSGGEKRRLQLLKVLMANPNFLILDEPTNDLDIVTLNVLEDYLDNFPGCLLVVSHDRYFMDRLVDHLFVFDQTDEIQDYPGNYTDFREIQDEKKSGKSAKKVPSITPSPEPANTQKQEGKRKLTYSEKEEFGLLEKDIAKLNARKAELEELLNSGESDHVILTEWSSEIQTINDTVDEKEMRWLELSEIAG
ncbi:MULTISPECIES: ABC-F family ATP-binding cassette domain-containing protein [Reichenbachiella]|uniref:ATP-binding cassette, subfamily F, uup n=1 Tax=Reichenbachiella agariperforans TaxID=156994 RepID=A0A1M6W3U3_REIAG|nr:MULTISPECIES: ABC-F family ATP-binding cassette domain-containing protein [Reichenbachiella]RJE70881.1 ABC transporter [Reichenbachiella sp. MSK19-1]SHK88195.1 ATP-binding cassette, subfamily F, uup [Reichenbachiella agariperforans]